MDGLHVGQLGRTLADVDGQRRQRAVLHAADFALHGRDGDTAADDAHAGVGAARSGVADNDAHAVVLHGGEGRKLHGVAREAVALNEGENRRLQHLGRPFAQPLGLGQRGRDVGVEAVFGGHRIVRGRGLEGQQSAQLAVRGPEQRRGARGVVLVEHRREALRVGEAHEPELGAVARFGEEVLDVAVEVGVVAGRHAQLLKPRQFLDRVGLAELEAAVALDFLRAQRQKAQAAVGHRLDLAEGAVGESDFYSW